MFRYIVHTCAYLLCQRETSWENKVEWNLQGEREKKGIANSRPTFLASKTLGALKAFVVESPEFLS